MEDFLSHYLSTECPLGENDGNIHDLYFVSLTVFSQ